MKIDKTGFKPKFEFKKGENNGKDKLKFATQEIQEEYLKYQNDYDKGLKKFHFDNKIYGNKIIKNALKNAQNDKCCFCEGKISHTEMLNILDQKRHINKTKMIKI